MAVPQIRHPLMKRPIDSAAPLLKANECIAVRALVSKVSRFIGIQGAFGKPFRQHRKAPGPREKLMEHLKQTVQVNRRSSL